MYHPTTVNVGRQFLFVTRRLCLQHLQVFHPVRYRKNKLSIQDFSKNQRSIFALQEWEPEKPFKKILEKHENFVSR